MIVQGPAAWRGRRPAPYAALSVRGWAWMLIGLGVAGFWLAVFAVAAADISGHRVTTPAWAIKVWEGRL